MPWKRRRLNLLLLRAALAALYLRAPAVSAAGEVPPGPLRVEEGELRPGLAAAYRSLVDGATLWRIERQPAFTLGSSSPHPRIPPGPFEVTWSGVLSVEEEGPIAFGAYLGGEARLLVGGVAALEARGEKETAWIEPGAPIELQPGAHRFTLRFRALAAVPARLQVWWEGKTFSREPLPDWRLHHLERELTPALQAGELQEKGRAVAGRLGCQRCHAGGLPGLDDPPPGPAIAGFGDRLSGPWLLRWLKEPAKLRAQARMPALFGADRQGFVERWIVSEHLPAILSEAAALGPAPKDQPAPKPPGDHRSGRRTFITFGCPACHRLPDPECGEQKELDRFPLQGLGDRMGAGRLAAFIEDPLVRYPDGRMCRLPLSPEAARDMAAYLLLWSPPSAPDPPEEGPPRGEEVAAVARRLGVHWRSRPKPKSMEKSYTNVRKMSVVRCAGEHDDPRSVLRVADRKGRRSMNTKSGTRTLAVLGIFLGLGAAYPHVGQAAGLQDDALLKALPKAKVSLADGIRQSSKAPEATISAKFELEEGKLSLSVYTVGKGLGVDAEHNVLKELAGSPEGATWHPETEIFKDVEHVSRASQQLTLMALSPHSLLDIIKKAEKDHPGTVYLITPILKERKPLFIVRVADQGKSVELHYDLMSGEAVKK
jgi:hypothetical protein